MAAAKKQVSDKSRILKVYLRLAKRQGMHPTRTDMKREGISRDKIRHHFGSLEMLRAEAKRQHPEEFAGVIDDELFSKTRKAALKADLKKYKRFVVTTAVCGAPLHDGFYQSLRTFCEKNDAKLLVLFSSDPGSRANDTNSIIPQELLDNEHLVTDDLALNSNIFISNIKLSAKHIDPITGLGRIGQREGTFIYASPKQRMKPIPTSNEKPPHVLMTTGAITKPAYTSRTYWNKRTAYIARHDHVIGAIIVEIVDNKYYHFRQIQAEKSGSFVDLGTYYQGDKVAKLPPEGFVIGDSHVTETDPTAEQAWEQIHDYTGNRDVFLHDMFSGVSINHHERKKKITRAILANKSKLNLEQELRAVAEYLNKWTRKARKVVVVESNHHEFLSEHYLQDGLYQDDPQNYLLGSKLATAMIEGHNPLRYALEKIIGLENPKKVVWLTRDQDYKIAGIELGAHGDKGANGSKGSLRAMENAYTNSVSGHSHTPEILRGAWQVGTSSYLKLSYNKGPSSWMHASCLVYKNGSRQMIISINGNWHLR